MSANPLEELRLRAQEHPDKMALKSPHNACTYREFVNLVDKMSITLIAAGFSNRSMAFVLIKPGLELYAMAFALFNIGCIPVIVDPGMGLKAMLRSYSKVPATGFIGIRRAHLLRRWAPRSFAHVQHLCGMQGSSLKGLGPQQANKPLPALPAAVQGDQLALISFTTGSTGPAKPVEITFGMLAASVAMIRQQFGQSKDDRDLVSVPLFGLVSLLIGSTVVIPAMNPGQPAKINPRRIADTLLKEGITTMFASPAFLMKLSEYALAQGLVFPQLKNLSSGGAPISLDTLRACQAMLGQESNIYSSWGATEALPLSTIRASELLAAIPHVIHAGLGMPLGQIMPGVELDIIEIHDEPIRKWSMRKALPIGEIGEILVTGPNVSKQYYNDSHAQTLHKVADETGRIWHRTGDVGWLNPEGCLIFTGRKAHIVLSPEGPMHSVACEGVSNQHPQVMRSALVGVRGQAIMVVQLKRASHRREWKRIQAELLAILAGNPLTRPIKTVLMHKDFPVDLRHNAKIERGKLGLWAAQQL